MSASDDNTVRIWDLHEPARRHRISAPESLTNVYDLALAEDGRMASASGDKGIRIWDSQTGKLIALLGEHQFGAVGVDFSPDGKKLASIGSAWPRDPDVPSELKLWDLETHDVATYEIIRAHPRLRSLARVWSARGKTRCDRR